MTNLIPSLLIMLSHVITGMILRDPMPMADFPPFLRSSNWKIYTLSSARRDWKIIKPERSGVTLDQSAEGHKSRNPVERLFGWRHCQWELITNLRSAEGKHSKLKERHVPSKKKNRECATIGIFDRSEAWTVDNGLPDYKVYVSFSFSLYTLTNNELSVPFAHCPVL